MNKIALVLILSLGFVLAGCGNKKSPTVQPADTTETTAMEIQDDITFGVAVCDDYFTKIIECVESIDSEADNTLFYTGLKQLKDQWAKIPAENLEDICVKATEQATNVYASAGCTF